MRRVLLILAVLLLPQSVFAVCTQTGSVSSSSSQIAPANDIIGTATPGRHYLLIQNTGLTNAMNVAMGSKNNATSTDLYLAPGGSWLLTMQGSVLVPAGDIAAISAGGTTYSFCDW